MDEGVTNAIRAGGETPGDGAARPPGRAVIALLALGLVGALPWAVAIPLARSGGNPILAYNGAFAVSFGLYLAAAALVVRGAAALRGRPWLLAALLGLALLPRLLLLASAPALSDDLYRYIWDGKVINAGIDPYRHAPADPELAPLRDRLWVPINQKAQHTPYPPAAQAVFALTYRLAPDSVRAQQVVATLADLLAIGALLLLLARLGLPRERVILYAWSPTPILHFAHSAHNDALLIAGLLLAVALAVGPAPAGRAGRLGSGVALAFAALVKLVPLLVAPLLLRRWRGRGGGSGGRGRGAGGRPRAPPRPPPPPGLGTEAGESVFNDSAHYLLVRLLAPFVAAPGPVAGLIAAAILGGVALALAVRGGDDRQLVRGVATLLGLALLLNAVVEPWYLAWLLPFVAVFLAAGPGRWPFAPTPLLGWLWVSGAIQLTDLTYLDPANERWWPIIRLIEYGPLLAIPLLGWLPALLARTRGAAPTR